MFSIGYKLKIMLNAEREKCINTLIIGNNQKRANTLKINVLEQFVNSLRKIDKKV
jgi:hypothetical protein